jgi:3-deoxy-manno-octulosonate cytidylyltransferase (CMP-KDO synthetase)
MGMQQDLTKSLRTIVAIPARMGSTRLPRKILADIKGKTLLERVIEGVGTSFGKIYVATDHPEISQVAHKSGAYPIMTSPEIASGSDRIWAAIKEIDCDLIINVQGDEPQIRAHHLEAFQKEFLKNPSLKMASLYHDIDGDQLTNPNAVKVVLDQDQYAIYFSRFPIPFSRISYSHTAHSNVSSLPMVGKHIGVYAFRKSFLEEFCLTPPAPLEIHEGLEQLRGLWLGAKIKMLPISSPIQGIDTEDDLERIRKLY